MGGLKRVYVRVSGRVQGVGFRYFTQHQAQALGLAGFVRNRPDGDVEMEAEGLSNRVSELVDAVRRGPPGSHVREVHTGDRPAEGIDSEFDIRF